MEHYCCKCLVNKVAHEGDVCASCGGNSKPLFEPTTSHRVTVEPQESEVETVSIPTRRRIISNVTNTSNQATVDDQPEDTNSNHSENNTTGTSQNSTSSANNQKTVKRKTSAPLQGVIQNFDSGVDERSFFVRVADSLFKGISYNGKNNLVMTEFQLYENWNSGYNSANSVQPVATRVVCYGKIAQGRPVENNDVRVYGVRDRTNNYFIAEQIENTTDGTFASFVPQKMSAALVRIIVLALALAILGLLSGVFFQSGSTRNMPVSMQQIIIGIFSIVAGIVMFFFAKGNQRPGRKPLLIGIAVLLVVLGVFIITLRDADTKIAQLGDALLKELVYIVLFRVGFSLLLGLGRPNPQIDKILNICFVIIGVIWAVYQFVTVFLA